MKIIEPGRVPPALRGRCHQCNTLLEAESISELTANHIGTCAVCGFRSVKFYEVSRYSVATPSAERRACGICYDANCSDPGGKH